MMPVCFHVYELLPFHEKKNNALKMLFETVLFILSSMKINYLFYIDFYFNLWALNQIAVSLSLCDNSLS